MKREKFYIKLATLAIPISILCSSSLAYADKSNKDYVEYIVKEGDSISSIAQKLKPDHFKTSNFVVKIQVKNNVDELIYPGQKLLIPIHRKWE